MLAQHLTLALMLAVPLGLCPVCEGGLGAGPDLLLTHPLSMN